MQANAAWARTAQTAASFANTEFFGIHTFFFNEDATQQTKFRWHVEPLLGVKTLSSDEAGQLGLADNHRVKSRRPLRGGH